jgi:decaprenyl-phosphate phosphoribosyltransferase
MALVMPRQWVKNALVIAAPGAAGALDHDDVPARVLTARCVLPDLGGGLRAQRRARPRRGSPASPQLPAPVAAGELTARGASPVAAGWLTIGLIVCTMISPLLTRVDLACVTITLSYSWRWRHLPVLACGVWALGLRVPDGVPWGCCR